MPGARMVLFLTVILFLLGACGSLSTNASPGPLRTLTGNGPKASGCCPVQKNPPLTADMLCDRASQPFRKRAFRLYS